VTLLVFSVEHAATQLGMSHVTLQARIRNGQIKPSGLHNNKQPIFTAQDISRIKKALGEIWPGKAR